MMQTVRHHSILLLLPASLGLASLWFTLTPSARADDAPAAPAAAPAAAPSPVEYTPPLLAQRAAVSRCVDTALESLRKSQNADGSWGIVQPRYQTGLVILAFLSAGRTPDSDPQSPLIKAARWMLEHSTDDGFMGDSVYPMESHAIGALALSEMVGQIADPALATQVYARADRALQYTLTNQDKAVGAEFYGGWKADAKLRANDRTVTAWCLLQIRSMELRGAKIPPSALARASAYLEGSQKDPSDGKSYDKADIGGFSYDAAGLPVTTVTGAGLAMMSLLNRSESRRDAAVNWLKDNRPQWYGPNFYYTHFFTARGLDREARRSASSAAVADRYFTSIWDLLHEHQNPDGSFTVPPGNAENTQQMGAPYATAMAILVLSAPRSLLPIDACNTLRPNTSARSSGND
jgi:hypothetical protein